MSESKEILIFGLPIFEYRDKSPTKAPPQPHQPNFFDIFLQNTLSKDQIVPIPSDNPRKLPVPEPTSPPETLQAIDNPPKTYKAKDWNDYLALTIIYHNGYTSGNENFFYIACKKYNKEPEFRKYVDLKLEGLKTDIDKKKNNAGEDANGVAERLLKMKGLNETELDKFMSNRYRAEVKGKTENRAIILKPDGQSFSPAARHNVGRITDPGGQPGIAGFGPGGINAVRNIALEHGIEQNPVHPTHTKSKPRTKLTPNPTPTSDTGFSIGSNGSTRRSPSSTTSSRQSTQSTQSPYVHDRRTLSWAGDSYTEVHNHGNPNQPIEYLRDGLESSLIRLATKFGLIPNKSGPDRSPDRERYSPGDRYRANLRNGFSYPTGRHQ